jgi:F0F1-type ATP synthase epsilon subunit
MDKKKEVSNLLHVFVMTGDSVIYDDKAASVSSRNERGRFDILPLHTNFISIIKEFVLIKQNPDLNKQIVIKNGIMRVFENNVQIFVGSGE